MGLASGGGKALRLRGKDLAGIHRRPRGHACLPCAEGDLVAQNPLAREPRDGFALPAVPLGGPGTDPSLALACVIARLAVPAAACDGAAGGWPLAALDGLVEGATREPRHRLDTRQNIAPAGVRARSPGGRGALVSENLGALRWRGVAGLAQKGGAFMAFFAELRGCEGAVRARSPPSGGRAAGRTAVAPEREQKRQQDQGFLHRPRF